MDKQKPSAIFNSLPYMRFDLDPIDHPKYGKAKLCGEIPFVLPFRGYTIEQIHPDLPQCRKLAEENIELGRAVWPDDENEKVLQKLYEYIFGCTMMAGMDAKDPRAIIYPYAMILFNGINDQVDTSENFEIYASSYKEFVEEFRSPEFIMRKLPAATADIGPLLECWDGLRSRLLEIPDFLDKHQAGLKKTFGYYVASKMAMQELKRSGLSFSDSTTNELLRNVGTQVIGAELVAICRDAILPDYIRMNDVNYDTARNTTSDIEVLMNALFCLPRHLKLNQVDSPIMCSVVQGRMDLQTACNKAHADLLNALHDFKTATDMLLQNYPDDKNVAIYVDILRNGIDGMLYTYKFWQRYGISDKLTLCETKYDINSN